ncbi:MAG TPA: hypothetical protein VD905_19260 [Flavobacteriales bacterium]|nr:hypothetical protein [Flavobacteriales bacterium]
MKRIFFIICILITTTAQQAYALRELPRGTFRHITGYLKQSNFILPGILIAATGLLLFFLLSNSRMTSVAAWSITLTGTLIIGMSLVERLPTDVKVFGGSMCGVSLIASHYVYKKLREDNYL